MIQSDLSERNDLAIAKSFITEAHGRICPGKWRAYGS